LRKDIPVMKTAPIISIRLDAKQVKLINKFKAETGLTRSFIVRCCIAYALKKIVNGEVDILNLQEIK
jgi:hypothetical protein